MGLSNDKNLGLRPWILSTESLGPCFSHSMGDHDQILQYIKYIWNSPFIYFTIYRRDTVWDTVCFKIIWVMVNSNGPLARYVKLRFAIAPGMPGTFPARGWCTCRDACRDCWLAISFEDGSGENVPDIPGACATHNFAYLERGPLHCSYNNKTFFIQIFEMSTFEP